MIRLAASGISLRFQSMGGLLERFTVHDMGRDIAPLHRAPWVGSGEVMPQDTPPHLGWLGGDFLCAPFALEEGSSGLHGWPANGTWTARASASDLTAQLGETVQGARVTKHLRVRDDQPFVYQTHRFDGGTGTVSVSNHANVSVPNGAVLSTSAKRLWETPAMPQESDPARGRSALSYPAHSTDPTCFPAGDTTVDLMRYPWGPCHEDFVIGTESVPGLGWTALVRPTEGDVFLSLCNTGALPMTMLWHSNGGRDYAPWSGRHHGCLGIETGAAAHMLSASCDQDLTGPGALQLGTTAEVRHVLGALAWPAGERVETIEQGDAQLTLTGTKGACRSVPFDTEFLFREPKAALQ